MKKILPLFFAILHCFAYSQTIIEGVSMPNQIKSGSQNIQLNGGGVREKFFLDLYVAGLYLKTPSSDASKIMGADEAMGIRIQIVSGLISSEKMAEAVDEGFKNSSQNLLPALKTRIQQFKDVFKEEIKKGDIYEILYEPGKGTMVYKNGKLSATIPGVDFKKGLFGIWLCEVPAQESLKAAMLGKK